MSGKIQLKQSVKVKQTVNLRRTIKFASLGTSAAGLICLIFFIAFNSSTSNVVAGNQGNNFKSFVEELNFHSSSLANEFQSKLEESNAEFNSLKANLTSNKKNVAASIIHVSPPEDFIQIYPKNTSGIFNVEFEMPEKGNFIPQIDIVNRKGKVVESKVVQPEDGKVLESFIMDNNLPNGPYLVRVSINRQLYVRQVVLQKNL